MHESSKQWFKRHAMTLEYNAIEPVWRRKRIYAVAYPTPNPMSHDKPLTWATLPFETKEALARYISKNS